MKLREGIERVFIESHADQLKYRKTGFGGSDFGALVGISQYKSPFAVIESKFTETPDIQSEPAYWGQQLEDLVAGEFTKRNPHLTVINPKGYLLIESDRPFLLASLDRIIDYGDDLPPAPLEIKTSTAFALSEWVKGDIPQTYILQVQHYIYMLGATHGFLAVLVGGQQYMEYRIERDQDIIDGLLSLALQFWPYVERKELPPLALCDATDLKRLFTKDNGQAIELNDDTDTVIAALNALKDQGKEISKHIDALELKLKQRMADNYMAVTPTRQYVKLSTTTTTRFNSKRLQAEHPELFASYQETSTSRRLSTGKLKKEN